MQELHEAWGTWYSIPEELLVTRRSPPAHRTFPFSRCGDGCLLQHGSNELLLVALYTTEYMSQLPVLEFELDDGHRPGKSSMVPRMVVHRDELQFFEVFDGVLEEDWRDRAYQFAIEHGRPWGAYVTREEAIGAAVDIEALYKISPIQAIGNLPLPSFR